MSIRVYQSENLPKRPARIMIYGDTGAGKSYAAASWPRPIFLMNGRREGDHTLREFPGISIVELDGDDDMREAIEIVRENKGKWDTIVLDTITYATDAALEVLSDQPTGRGFTDLKRVTPIAQRDWGKLTMYFLRSVEPTLARLPMHVIYVAMARFNWVRNQKTNELEMTKVEPAIPGQTRERLPGKCDIVGYIHRVDVPKNGRIVSEPRMVIRPSDEVIARFPGKNDEREIIPTFEEIAKRLPWLERNPVSNPSSLDKRRSDTREITKEFPIVE